MSYRRSQVRRTRDPEEADWQETEPKRARRGSREGPADPRCPNCKSPWPFEDEYCPVCGLGFDSEGPNEGE